jgi:hypothetical protein
MPVGTQIREATDHGVTEFFGGMALAFEKAKCSPSACATRRAGALFRFATYLN